MNRRRWNRDGLSQLYRSLIILLVLVLGVPVWAGSGQTVHAASCESIFAAGCGTEEDPWVIMTPEQLDRMRDFAEYHFRLGRDVDLTEYLADRETGWEPIPAFHGTLDGGGHAIKGLWIRQVRKEPNDFVTGHGLGLFKQISESATIRDLHVLDADVYGFSESGILASENEGQIINVFVHGTITTDKNGRYIGGLVGRNGNSGRIQRSKSAAIVNGGNQTGGLVGINAFQASVSQSFSISGQVTGKASVGGLIGWNAGPVQESISDDVHVTGTSNVGGFIGTFNYQSSYPVVQSASSGSVQGDENVGGIVGHHDSYRPEYSLLDIYSSADVTGHKRVGGLIGYDQARPGNGYSTGNVRKEGTGVGGSIGGAIGEGSRSPEHYNQYIYYNQETTEPKYVSSRYGKPLTEAQMKQQGSYAKFDFDTVWTIDEGVTYPRLRALEPLWDEMAVFRDLLAVEIGFAGSDTADHVTHNIVLPTAGVQGTTIQWQSDHPAIDPETGQVTREPSNGADVAVTLTATVAKGDFAEKRTFVLTVIRQPAPSAEHSSVVVEPGAGDPVAGVDTRAIRVIIKDEYENPMAGKKVTLTADAAAERLTIMPESGTTDGNGETDFTVSSTKAGEVTFVAWVDGLELGRVAITFVAGDIDPANSTVDVLPGHGNPIAGAAHRTITVTLIDKFGNAVAGREVTLEANGDATGVSITTDNRLTDERGQASFAVSRTKPGTVVLTARVGAVEIGQAIITFVAGDIDPGNSTVDVLPGHGNPVAGEHRTITVTLTDEIGNAVAGEKVTISTGAGASTVSIMPESQLTDGNGQASFTVSSTKTGAVTFTAWVGALEIGQASLTYVPGDVDMYKSGVDATPSTVIADGKTSATVTVTLRDAHDNPIGGTAVELTARAGDKTVESQLETTDASGVATFLLAHAIAEQVTLAAKAEGVELTAKPVITFIAGEVDPARSSVVVDKTVVRADGVSTANIVTRVSDAAGNPVRDYPVELIQVQGTSTIVQSEGTSDSDGFVSFAVHHDKPEKAVYQVWDGVLQQWIANPVEVTFGGVLLSTDQLLIQDGEAESYFISMNSAPNHTVTIQVYGEGSLAFFAETILFTPDNWKSPQRVTVTTENLLQIDHMTQATVTHTVYSQDPLFHEWPVPNLLVTLVPADEKPGEPGGKEPGEPGGKEPAKPDPKEPETDNRKPGGQEESEEAEEAEPDTGVRLFVEGAAFSGNVETTMHGHQSVTTVRIDADMQPELFNTLQQGAVLEVVMETGSDIHAVELPGSSLSLLQQNGTVIKLKTAYAYYMLHADAISTERLLDNFTETVPLNHLQLRIQVALLTETEQERVHERIGSLDAELLAPPVNFTVLGVHQDEVVATTRFEGFVERWIPLSDHAGDRLTTAARLDQHGLHHVPTKRFQVDGQDFAVIHSMTNSLYAAIHHEADFGDVAGHWAESAIRSLGSRLILHGLEGNEYRPHGAVTRAEFAAILVRALGLNGLDIRPSSFRDMPADAWYAGAVHTAHAYGIIHGFPDDTLKPLEQITREQAMVMLAGAMTLADLPIVNADGPAASELDDFDDVHTVSAWAKPSVAKVVQAGLVSGRSESELAPDAKITRAEMAVIVERLLRKLIQD